MNEIINYNFLISKSNFKRKKNDFKYIKQHSGKKPRILVVDDEAHILNLVKLSLQDDFEVIEAKSGHDAIKIARNEHPDLITLDIMMPEMSGFEIAEILRNDTKTSDIPIIFLSAKDKLKDMYTGLELDAEDYIIKPFNPEELNLRIKNILKQINRMGE